MCIKSGSEIGKLWATGSKSINNIPQNTPESSSQTITAKWRKYRQICST